MLDDGESACEEIINNSKRAILGVAEDWKGFRCMCDERIECKCGRER